MSGPHPGSRLPDRPHPERHPTRPHTHDGWWIAAVAVVATLLVALTVWVLVDGHRDSTPAAAPAPTSSSTPPGPAPTPQDTERADATSEVVPGPVERCGDYYLKRQFGSILQVRECDPQFALFDVGPGRSGLYRWQDDRWAFVADPYSGVCREQLEQVGVTERFRRDFPPCDRGSSPTRSSEPQRTEGAAPTGRYQQDGGSTSAPASGSLEVPTGPPGSGEAAPTSENN